MSKNTVKTKTIGDLDWYDDLGWLPDASIFVQPYPTGDEEIPLHRTNLDEVYRSYELAYRPTYEQSFAGMNMAGRKLRYPIVCQEHAMMTRSMEGICWRVIFMNEKDTKLTSKIQVSDGTGDFLSANLLSDESYTTIDWPWPVTDYLSVLNAGNANVQVLLRGYVGGYPDIPSYYSRAYKNINNVLYQYSNAMQIGKYALAKCDFETFEIPDKTRIIGEYAFYNCSCLTSVTIPDSVMSIGNYAFSGCDSLTSTNITDIAKWCGISFGNFSANPLYCAHNLYLNGNKVSDLLIPNGVMNIMSYAFYNCSCLTSVTIPDSVTSIGSNAFRGCGQLINVTIGNGVTSIGNYIFYNCKGLTSVTIPDSVMSIGNYAFSGCSGLTNVTIPNSVTSIGFHVFYKCTGLTSVTIPDSVTGIGDEAFSGCSMLTSVMFEGNAPNIGIFTFQSVAAGCTAYVHRGSSGWGVTIPGKWHQIKIAYIEDQTA